MEAKRADKNPATPDQIPEDGISPILLKMTAQFKESLLAQLGKLNDNGKIKQLTEEIIDGIQALDPARYQILVAVIKVIREKKPAGSTGTEEGIAKFTGNVELARNILELQKLSGMDEQNFMTKLMSLIRGIYPLGVKIATLHVDAGTTTIKPCDKQRTFFKIYPKGNDVVLETHWGAIIKIEEGIPLNVGRNLVMETFMGHRLSTPVEIKMDLEIPNDHVSRRALMLIRKGREILVYDCGNKYEIRIETLPEPVSFRPVLGLAKKPDPRKESISFPYNDPQYPPDFQLTKVQEVNPPPNDKDDVGSANLDDLLPPEPKPDKSK